MVTVYWAPGLSYVNSYEGNSQGPVSEFLNLGPRESNTRSKTIYFQV